MAVTADRYVRRGTAVPEIYHGTLRSLQLALSQTAGWSRRCPGPHVLEAVYGGTRVVLRVFEDGECTWTVADS